LALKVMQEIGLRVCMREVLQSCWQEAAVQTRPSQFVLGAKRFQFGFDQASEAQQGLSHVVTAFCRDALFIPFNLHPEKESEHLHLSASHQKARFSLGSNPHVISSPCLSFCFTHIGCDMAFSKA